MDTISPSEGGGAGSIPAEGTRQGEVGGTRVPDSPVRLQDSPHKGVKPELNPVRMRGRIQFFARHRSWELNR